MLQSARKNWASRKKLLRKILKQQVIKYFAKRDQADDLLNQL